MSVTVAAAHSIPLCVPHMTGTEFKYLRECIDTNFVSSVGPFVARFERQVADYVDSRYAVATVNGTAALHLGLLVVGVEPDDEVIVSTLTFIAPVNAIRYVGAYPVFIDADRHTWQLDPDRLADFLRHECDFSRGVLRNRRTGRRIRALLPVNIVGHSVDWDSVGSIAREYGLPIVEDATESLGARYNGTPTGRFGSVACFSFNGNKLITTGGGGMLVTDDSALGERARYLSTTAKDDDVEFIHGAVGYNYRLTNIQAAVGCAQMEHVDAFVSRKREIAARYAEALSIPGITPMREPPGVQSAFWMYTVLVEEREFGMDSRRLLAELGQRSIQTRPLWQPAHMSPAHRDVSAGARCPVAEWLNRTALSLPCSVGLTAQDQEAVTSAILQLRRG